MVLVFKDYDTLPLNKDKVKTLITKQFPKTDEAATCINVYITPDINMIVNGVVTPIVPNGVSILVLTPSTSHGSHDASTLNNFMVKFPNCLVLTCNNDRKDLLDYKGENIDKAKFAPLLLSIVKKCAALYNVQDEVQIIKANLKSRNIHTTVDFAKKVLYQDVLSKTDYTEVVIQAPKNIRDIFKTAITNNFILIATVKEVEEDKKKAAAEEKEAGDDTMTDHSNTTPNPDISIIEQDINTPNPSRPTENVVVYVITYTEINHFITKHTNFKNNGTTVFISKEDLDAAKGDIARGIKGDTNKGLALVLQILNQASGQRRLKGASTTATIDSNAMSINLKAAGITSESLLNVLNSS
jgi:hypothetical protein